MKSLSNSRPSAAATSTAASGRNVTLFRDVVHTLDAAAAASSSSRHASLPSGRALPTSVPVAQTPASTATLPATAQSTSVGNKSGMQIVQAIDLAQERDNLLGFHKQRMAELDAIQKATESHAAEVERAHKALNRDRQRLANEFETKVNELSDARDRLEAQVSTLEHKEKQLAAAWSRFETEKQAAIQDAEAQLNALASALAASVGVDLHAEGGLLGISRIGAAASGSAASAQGASKGSGSGSSNGVSQITTSAVMDVAARLSAAAGPRNSALQGASIHNQQNSSSSGGGGGGGNTVMSMNEIMSIDEAELLALADRVVHEADAAEASLLALSRGPSNGAAGAAATSSGGSATTAAGSSSTPLKPAGAAASTAAPLFASPSIPGRLQAVRLKSTLQVLAQRTAALHAAAEAVRSREVLLDQREEGLNALLTRVEDLSEREAALKHSVNVLTSLANQASRDSPIKINGVHSHSHPLHSSRHRDEATWRQSLRTSASPPPPASRSPLHHAQILQLSSLAARSPHFSPSSSSASAMASGMPVMTSLSSPIRSAASPASPSSPSIASSSSPRSHTQSNNYNNGNNTAYPHHLTSTGPLASRMAFELREQSLAQREADLYAKQQEIEQKVAIAEVDIQRRADAAAAAAHRASADAAALAASARSEVESLRNSTLSEVAEAKKRLQLDVDAAKAAMSVELAALQQDRASIVEARHQIAAERSAVDAERSAIAAARREIGDATVAIRARQSELEAIEATIADRQASLQEVAMDLDAREQSLRDRESMAGQADTEAIARAGSEADRIIQHAEQRAASIAHAADELMASAQDRVLLIDEREAALSAKESTLQSLMAEAGSTVAAAKDAEAIAIEKASALQTARDQLLAAASATPPAADQQQLADVQLLKEQLAHEKASLQSQSDKIEAERGQLEAMRVDLDARSVALDERTKRVDHAATEAQSAWDSIEEIKASLKDHSHALKQTKAEMQEQALALKEESEALHSQKAQLDAERASMAQQLQAREAALSTRETALSAKEANILSQQAHLDAKQQELATLQVQLDARDPELAASAAGNSAAPIEAYSQQQQEEVVAESKRLALLREQLDEQQSVLSEQRTQLQAQQSALEVQKAEFEAASALELEKRSQQDAVLDRKAQQLQSAFAELADRKAALEQRVKDVTEQFKQREAALKQLEVSIAEREASAAQSEQSVGASAPASSSTAITAAPEDQQQLQSMVDQLTEACRSLESRLADAKMSTAEEKAAKEQAFREKSEAARQVQSLEAAHAAATAKCAELEVHITTLQDGLRRAEHALEVSQARVKSLETEISSDRDGAQLHLAQRLQEVESQLASKANELHDAQSAAEKAQLASAQVQRELHEANFAIVALRAETSELRTLMRKHKQTVGAATIQRWARQRRIHALESAFRGWERATMRMAAASSATLASASVTTAHPAMPSWSAAIEDAAAIGVQQHSQVDTHAPSAHTGVAELEASDSADDGAGGDAAFDFGGGGGFSFDFSAGASSGAGSFSATAGGANHSSTAAAVPSSATSSTLPPAPSPAAHRSSGGGDRDNEDASSLVLSPASPNGGGQLAFNDDVSRQNSASGAVVGGHDDDSADNTEGRTRSRSEIPSHIVCSICGKSVPFTDVRAHSDLCFVRHGSGGGSSSLGTASRRQSGASDHLGSQGKSRSRTNSFAGGIIQALTMTGSGRKSRRPSHASHPHHAPHGHGHAPASHHSHDAPGTPSSSSFAASGIAFSPSSMNNAIMRKFSFVGRSRSGSTASQSMQTPATPVMAASRSAFDTGTADSGVHSFDFGSESAAAGAAEWVSSSSSEALPASIASSSSASASASAALPSSSPPPVGMSMGHFLGSSQDGDVTASTSDGQ